MECHMMAIAARIFEAYSAGRDHERESADLDQGFNGDWYEIFDQLGFNTTRLRYVAGKFVDERERNAMEIWLERHDRSEARRATRGRRIKVTISALTLVVLILTLVVTFSRT
jgi:hypothetical protein